MGILDIFQSPKAMASHDPSERNAADDRFFDGHVGRSEIGVTVTVERARQVPVVRDCLQTLSDSVAGLQFGVFKRKGDGSAERFDNHPVVRLFENPNRRQTSFDFLKHIVDDLEAYGDYHAEIVFDVDGNPSELLRLDPATTSIDETADGTKRFKSTSRNGTQRILLEDEAWHIPLPPIVDNLVGRSPILHDGREAVAVAIALQKYANTFFTNDATPPYALSMDGRFKDEASKKNFMNAWRRWVTGKNRHVPGILEQGITPHRMGVTNEEAQFLETRKELWLDLTRIWKVPPHKVGVLDKATFSNIEHQGLEFVIDTLRPILELIERSVTKFLIEEPDLYFEFNVESLLRGDIKARYEAYALGRQWGWLSVNDILRAENKNGIGPAGDRYIEPLNMVPVGTGLQQRDRDSRAGIENAISFLHSSVSEGERKTRLELIKDAA